MRLHRQFPFLNFLPYRFLRLNSTQQRTSSLTHQRRVLPNLNHVRVRNSDSFHEREGRAERGTAEEVVLARAGEEP